MSRWVVPHKAGLRSASGDTGDDALARIIKFVPTEIVSAFTLLFSVLAGMNLPATQRLAAAAGLIGLFLVVTIFWVAIKSPAGLVRKAHLFVSPFAFLAWAYPISSSALGSYFNGLISFAAQAIVIALSIFVTPRE